MKENTRLLMIVVMLLFAVGTLIEAFNSIQQTNNADYWHSQYKVEATNNGALQQQIDTVKQAYAQVICYYSKEPCVAANGQVLVITPPAGFSPSPIVKPVTTTTKKP